MSDVMQTPSEFILYQTEDGRTRIQCRFENETIWLSQIQVAELFQTTKQNIAKHLKAIFAEREMKQEAVVNYWLTTVNTSKTIARIATSDHFADFGKMVGKRQLLKDAP